LHRGDQQQGADQRVVQVGQLAGLHALLALQYEDLAGDILMLESAAGLAEAGTERIAGCVPEPVPVERRLVLWRKRKRREQRGFQAAAKAEAAEPEFRVRMDEALLAEAQVAFQFMMIPELF